MRGRGNTQKWLPLAYFAAAIALTVALLPSVLRQQPPETNQSASLSPDAPPDHDSVPLISSFQPARSATAGSADAPEVLAELAPPVTRSARACRGFGNPPRQVESFYSAPCAPPCPAPLGPSHRNVSDSEVRIGIRHEAVVASQDGPIPTTPQPNESAIDRSYRVMQAWFNDRFETCGRQIRLVQLPEGGDSDATAAEGRAVAVLADEKERVFAAYVLNVEACKEFVRRQIVAWCNPSPRQVYDDANGLLWTWMADYTRTDQFSAEVLCKQLHGKPARFTNDTTLAGKPRKFGIIYWASSPSGGRTTAEIERFYDDRCGGAFAVAVNLTNEDMTADIPAITGAITRMKSEGVTTIVLGHNVIMDEVIFGSASAQLYYPEWFAPTPFALDFNSIGKLEPADQMRNVFGFSGWEISRPWPESDCFAAHHSIDPYSDPDTTFCMDVFGFMLQLVNGIQAAGPRLTPETYRDGLFAMGKRFYPERWAIGGGYEPGDFTYTDDFGFIWWDPDAGDPESPYPGAYRWLHEGRRFRHGEVPEEPLRWFDEGVTTIRR